jgi:hypothetical protein
VVLDDNANPNPKSNLIEIEFPGHTTVGGVDIAGNLVPWGETLCLVEEDLVAFMAPCPTCEEGEGGCVRPTHPLYIPCVVSFSPLISARRAREDA